MGSYRKCIMTGFICRLCSEHKSIVIHLYSHRAKCLGLIEKLSLLPISIKVTDKLPKTICESCIRNVCRQYEMVQQMTRNIEIVVKHRKYHVNGECPDDCPLKGAKALANSVGRSDPGPSNRPPGDPDSRQEPSENKAVNP
ncbi:PREDICTED: uncharacterized protein LOC108566169 [Nicrophorus vespilloides]|uniref:Uncharacterized protein LOC108566169 n=1 Tax=Nicrophorus vespilloides TaxID=110193 RepID=A0ABM1N3M6_NICVS|nr:PREDICTED: uncharacterized protein LOC108566169 [Nicrophorus vespilloides]